MKRLIIVSLVIFVFLFVATIFCQITPTTNVIKFGNGYIDPCDENQKDFIGVNSIQYLLPRPSSNKIEDDIKTIVLVKIEPSSYQPGYNYNWCDLRSKIDVESIAYDYFDNEMWRGESKIGVFNSDFSTEVININPQPIDIDPVLMLYNVVKIKAVETPGGEIGKSKIEFYEYDLKKNLLIERKLHGFYPQQERNFQTEYPSSIFCENGNLVVCEKNKKVISKYTKEGKLLSEIGKGILVSPIDVASYKNRYYVADEEKNSILVFDSSGNYIKSIKDFNKVGKIYIKNNKLFVVDTTTNVVKVFDPVSLQKIKEIVLHNTSCLTGICVDDIGDIYVCDKTGVKKFNPKGELIWCTTAQTFWTGFVLEINSPTGIEVDNQGIVYVTSKGYITFLDAITGNIIDYMNEKNGFSHPSDVCIDNDGILYISDPTINQVISYKLDSRISPVKPLVLNIKFPQNKTIVRLDDLTEDKRLCIKGSISSSELVEYKVYFGKGKKPDIWYEVWKSSKIINDDIICELDTNNLQNGVYSLKIQMFYKTKFSEDKILTKEKIVSFVFLKWDEFVDNFEETKENMFWINELPEIKSYPWTIKGEWKKSDKEKFEGTNSIGIQNVNDTSEIVSPTIDLTVATPAILCFWIKYNLEHVPIHNSYYCSFVQITTNDGRTWKDIEPVDGYPAERPEVQISKKSKCVSKKSFYGSCPDWTRVKFDLSPYIGKKIKVKIVCEAIKNFPWFDYGNYIYIDDFCIKQSSIDWYKDIIPPGKITDLEVLTDEQIKLVWTSVGSDGYSYGIKNGKWEIKYTTDVSLQPYEVKNTILVNFNLSFPGEKISYYLDNLLSKTTYYFWIRTIDENGNTSVWSEKASGVSGIYSKKWSFVSTSAKVVEIADVDNDGYKDIFFSDGSVYRNENNFKFTKIWQKTIPETYSTDISAGDFNNDGLTDFVSIVCDRGIRVYSNNGNYNFTLLWKTDTQEELVAVKVVDIDNDGFLDFITLANNGKLKVYKNIKSKKFSLIWSYKKTFTQAYSLSCRDYDNDGYTDILVIASQQIMLFKNLKNKRFELIWSTNTYANDIVFCDYDSDGLVDIITNNEIYKNNSQIEKTNFCYVDKISFSSGKIAIGDYDNDGDIDLAVNNKIYENRNKGQFIFSFDLGTIEHLYYYVCFEDFDNDKNLDVLLNYWYKDNYVTTIYKLFR